MNVIWHPRAEKEKDKITDYIRWRVGYNRMEKFMQEVDETVQIIRLSPNAGFIDSLFAHRARTYRSVIINGLSKMVYYVKGDILHIAAFWDTRREPKNQARQTQ